MELGWSLIRQKRSQSPFTCGVSRAPLHWPDVLSLSFRRLTRFVCDDLWCKTDLPGLAVVVFFLVLPRDAGHDGTSEIATA